MIILLFENVDVFEPALYFAVNVFDPALTVNTNVALNCVIELDVFVSTMRAFSSAAAIMVEPDTSIDI